VPFRLDAAGFFPLDPDFFLLDADFFAFFTGP